METLEIKVTKTKAKKTQIVGNKDGIIQVEVAAPPENNRANLEIMRFFSKEHQKFVTIIRGTKSNKKTLALN